MSESLRSLSLSRRKGLRVVLILTCLLALAWLWPARGAAQVPTPTPRISDDQVNAIAREMYCPVCENTPLDVCPTQACAEWRELIREKLAEGWSEAQIKQYFVERYGDRVLATPPPRGLNWLAYLVPPAGILLGVFLFYSALRAWRRPAVEAPPSAAPSDDEYIRRLEEELRQR